MRLFSAVVTVVLIQLTTCTPLLADRALVGLFDEDEPAFEPTQTSLPPSHNNEKPHNGFPLTLLPSPSSTTAHTTQSLTATTTSNSAASTAGSAVISAQIETTLSPSTATSYATASPSATSSAGAASDSPGPHHNDMKTWKTTHLS